MIIVLRIAEMDRSISTYYTIVTGDRRSHVYNTVVHENEAFPVSLQQSPGSVHFKRQRARGAVE